MNTVKIKITRTIIPIVLVANFMVFTSCSNKANQAISNTVASAETLQCSTAINNQANACGEITDDTSINSENIITNDIKSINNGINILTISSKDTKNNIISENKITTITNNSINKASWRSFITNNISTEYDSNQDISYPYYIKCLNLNNNAKYFKSNEKITLDLFVGWKNGYLENCSIAEIVFTITEFSPDGSLSNKNKFYTIKDFSNISYKYKSTNKPGKKIKITIDRPCNVGYGTIDISLYALQSIKDVGTDNTYGYSNDESINYIVDEYGNVLISTAYAEPTKVNGESLANYKLLLKDDPLLIYSRKKLLDEGKITQKQYDRELFIMTRNYDVYSYDIIDKISGYKNKIDLDDNGTNETISFIETSAKNGYEKKMTISLKTSDEKKSSININYLRKVRIYENHCISNQLYEKSFNYYSISAETQNGEYKTWLIGYKDGKLICSNPYDGIFKGVDDYGFSKYLIKMSDVENDSVETKNDCRLFYVNNDMTLTTYDDNDNFNYKLNSFDRYKVE